MWISICKIMVWKIMAIRRTAAVTDKRNSPALLKRWARKEKKAGCANDEAHASSLATFGFIVNLRSLLSLRTREFLITCGHFISEEPNFVTDRSIISTLSAAELVLSPCVVARAVVVIISIISPTPSRSGAA
jgi:hypothetical protein